MVSALFKYTKARFVMEHFAVTLIGFSLVAAVLLAWAYRTVYHDITQSALSRASGCMMLLGFFVLQVLHWRYLTLAPMHGPQAVAELPHSRLYCVLLSANAAALYWFFLGLLRPVESQLAWFELVIPVAALVLSSLLPVGIAVPIAFVFGINYAAHLASFVYRLRAQRRWFRLELSVFMAFAAISLGVLGAGLAAMWVGPRIFVLSYSMLIGSSFALMLYLLLRFPDVLSKTAEAVAAAYLVSTLGKLDQSALLLQLAQALEIDRIFEDEALSLATLARRLKVSTHQLSELINTHFGISFSALIRQHRVKAAKKMLVEQPSASVLSIGMAVGFSSQSNFYAAFKEQTGQVPGQFRKSQRQ
jgi:AraC-like DNA-binding protein